MPYIDEKTRLKLNDNIESIVETIKDISISKYQSFDQEELNDNQVLQILGVLNYCFTRITMKCIGNITYNKIAMVTGVLDNIKQEFYRRVACWYEDKKILSNGDIKEYKHLH